MSTSTNTKVYKQPPYILWFVKGQQEFAYIGAMHCHDPEHPIFGIIELYWEEWVKGKTSKNAQVLVEGGTRLAGRSLKSTIQHDGEAGFLTYLAHKSGLPCATPEPDAMTEMNYLLKNFSREEILHYYFVRQVDQWHRTKKADRPEYAKYFSYLRKLPKLYGWDGYTLDTDKMEDIHAEIVGEPFDLGDAKLFSKLSDPYQKLAVTNKVSLKCGQFRDAHIVRRIKKYWDAGKNIFSVYGHSHLEVQEDDLRTLLK